MNCYEEENCSISDVSEREKTERSDATVNQNVDEVVSQLTAAPIMLTDKQKLVIRTLWAVGLGSLYGKSDAHRADYSFRQVMKTVEPQSLPHLIQMDWCLESMKNVSAFLTPEEIKGNADQGNDETQKLLQRYVTILTEEESQIEMESMLDTLEMEGQILRHTHQIVKELVTVSIKDGIYDARSRCALKKLSEYLEVSWDEIDEYEKSLIKELESMKTQEEESNEQKVKDEKRRKYKRAFFIGLTAIGGGAALALSAGLAAPFIGAGAVAVLGSGSAAVFTGVSGVAIITSIFGAAGAGLAGYKMTKRIGKTEQFEFDSLTNGKHLHVTIAVSGFCDTEDDSGFAAPWEALDNSTEQYCLKWEGKLQPLALYGSFVLVVISILKSIAWPLTLISAANMIDNPWHCVTQRSKEVGIELANVLLARHQGYRPVTLIGFSMGARVIFFCLLEMLSKQGCEGIIEDVIIIGAPVGGNSGEWDPLEKVISGTLYNVYCTSDWLLKFVYRTASVEVGDIAGLGPINVSWKRIVNVDVTDEIKNHTDYNNPEILGKVLNIIGMKTKEIESTNSPSVSPSHTAKAQSLIKDRAQMIVKDIEKDIVKVKPVISQNLISKTKDDDFKLYVRDDLEGNDSDSSNVSRDLVCSPYSSGASTPCSDSPRSNRKAVVSTGTCSSRLKGLFSPRLRRKNDTIQGSFTNKNTGTPEKASEYVEQQTNYEPRRLSASSIKVGSSDVLDVDGHELKSVSVGDSNSDKAEKKEIIEAEPKSSSFFRFRGKISVTSDMLMGRIDEKGESSKSRTASPSQSIMNPFTVLKEKLFSSDKDLTEASDQVPEDPSAKSSRKISLPSGL